MNTLPCHTARTGPVLNADSCSKSDTGGGMAFPLFHPFRAALADCGQSGCLAIAECCGWKCVDESPEFGKLWWDTPDHRTVNRVPSYCSDLNAIHAAINTLPSDGTWGRFVEELKCVCHWDDYSRDGKMMVAINATARQRSEAFLRTLGKWREATTYANP
jgi:hypothetical protein